MLRRFEVEYLWIDCLCIIQNDSADWKREAVSMASIYKNAAFTISALHCLGSSKSLFSDPNKALAAGFIGELSEGIPVHLEAYITHPFSYNSLRYRADEGHFGQPYGDDYIRGFESYTDPEMSLLSRGWVYQEVLLSPRTLYFLANEIMWRCRVHTICQCARYSLDADWVGQSDLKTYSHNGETLYYSGRGCKPVASRDWATIVEDYSSKDLTYPQDRMPALAGIAQEFGSSKGWTYICGHWQEDLSRTFGWTPRVHQTIRPESGLPTWSWASIETAVHIKIVCSEELEFESCQITYKNGGSPYLGDVEEAVLTVKGDVSSAKLLPPSYFTGSDPIGGSHDTCKSNTSTSNDVSGSADTSSGSEDSSESDDTTIDTRWGVSVCSRTEFRFFADYDLKKTAIGADDDVLCLYLSHWEANEVVEVDCLVLRRVDHHGEHYERLGVVAMFEDGGKGDWRARWGFSKRRLALV